MHEQATRVVISGCSGGGKSTLLSELARRGYAVFEEPGRAIVKEQLASGGDALPWRNAENFIRACIARGLEQWETGRDAGVCFYDRSLVDAFNGVEVLELTVGAELANVLRERRYHRRVFMTPPWPEIYVTDAERRHSFADAVAEYERLLRFYPRHGYEVVVLPKVATAERAPFVLANL
jgi:predicted ATPase